MEGSGKMLVLAVGEHSQTGKIFKLLDATKDDDRQTKSTQNKKESMPKCSKMFCCEPVFFFPDLTFVYP